MTNNDIMKKLRVALKLRDTDIVHILKLAGFDVSVSELGAIFRNEDHPNYKECGDQLLRNFLNGLIIHMRGPVPPGLEKKAAQTPRNFSREKPQLKPPSGKEDVSKMKKPRERK